MTCVPTSRLLQFDPSCSGFSSCAACVSLVGQGEVQGGAVRLTKESGTSLAAQLLCAFLDDVYLLCGLSRVNDLYVLLALIKVAGIHLD